MDSCKIYINADLTPDQLRALVKQGFPEWELSLNDMDGYDVVCQTDETHGLLEFIFNSESIHTTVDPKFTSFFKTYYGFENLISIEIDYASFHSEKLVALEAYLGSHFKVLNRHDLSNRFYRKLNGKSWLNIFRKRV